MIKRHNENPLIKPSDIAPSRDAFEVIGVFNGAALQVGNRTFLFLRVAERVKNNDPEKVIAPFWNSESQQIETRIFNKNSKDICFDDPRIVKTKEKIYLTSLSHFRTAWSEDGVHFDVAKEPCFSAATSFEAYGVEDPRLQRIEKCYYLTYSAVSEKGIATALAVSHNLDEFTRKGLIFLPNNRNVVLFPEKIQGQYVALHRPFGHGWSEGAIWMACSPDLLHWGRYEPLMGPRPGFWDNFKIGAGAPPFKTDKGWVLIYHGVDASEKYALGVVLLDLENPMKICGRSQEPFLYPEAPYERKGFFGNVVFTCGAIQRKDKQVDIYYGASDEVLCLASLSEKELIQHVEKC